MKHDTHITERALLAVIAGLIVLTALSWAVSYVHLPGVLGLAVALGIAGVKISLVALFFMELRAHRGGVRFAAAVGPLFIVTLVLLMLVDVWTR